mmetsp:Transcript_34203/g.78881  ORF Transcript_34203/g.78881 Transcript_34203/m.78881 type:complete len:153 (+) Transcript_34203:291-749(+)
MISEKLLGKRTKRNISQPWPVCNQFQKSVNLRTIFDQVTQPEDCFAEGLCGKSGPQTPAPEEEIHHNSNARVLVGNPTIPNPRAKGPSGKPLPLENSFGVVEILCDLQRNIPFLIAFHRSKSVGPSLKKKKFMSASERAKMRAQRPMGRSSS